MIPEKRSNLGSNWSSGSLHPSILWLDPQAQPIAASSHNGHTSLHYPPSKTPAILRKQHPLMHFSPADRPGW